MPTEVAPSEAFLAVDRLCRLAESAGWPIRSAFFMAMILYVQNVSLAEAEQMLPRRVQ